MFKIAIIAAMEREVAPLIRNWKVRTMEHGGQGYRLFENGGVTLVCGGIGAVAARRATEAVIREVSPERVISVGFAGALNRSMKIGDVLEPRTVINAADGARTEVGLGEGILVSCATVAGKEQKSRLSKAYGASAVDMEAASVAQGAQARGVDFGALKVISDAADFNLPPVDHFVAPDGTFRSGKYALHVGLRPWLWGATIALARNSSRAREALCGALLNYVGRHTLSDEATVAEWNPTTVDREFAGAQTNSSTRHHTEADGKR